LEKNTSRQHVPAFLLQIRFIPHDLSPTDQSSWFLNRLPADRLIKGTGSAIEGIFADFKIDHSRLHPDTLVLAHGKKPHSLAFMFTRRFS
jgi:hypothetical protein